MKRNATLKIPIEIYGESKVVIDTMTQIVLKAIDLATIHDGINFELDSEDFGKRGVRAVGKPELVKHRG